MKNPILQISRFLKLEGRATYFVGAILTPVIQNKLSDTQNSLKQINNKVKWVKSDQLHLTVCYIGGRPTEIEPLMNFEIAKAINSLSQIRLFNAVIALAPKQNPYLIWLEFEQNEEFTKISELLQESLKVVAPVREIIIPHITFGRFTGNRNYIDLGDHKMSNFQLHIKGVALYKQGLDSNAYEVIKQYEFNEKS